MLVALLVTAGACGSITVPNADSGVEPDSAAGNDAASTDVGGNDTATNDAPANDAATDTVAMTDPFGLNAIIDAGASLDFDTIQIDSAGSYDFTGTQLHHVAANEDGGPCGTPQEASGPH